MKKLVFYKKQAVDNMVYSINERAKEKGIDLTNKIPDDVNDFDEVFDDGGEARCDYFCDLSWEYALQFGTPEDWEDKNGFEAHVWDCIDAAIAKLKKRWNKEEKQLTK